MKARLVGILLIFLLVLAMIPAASAQDADTLCLQLSEADCAILQEATLNSENIASFNASFNFNLEIGNIGVLGAMMGSAEDVPEAIIITANADNSPFKFDMAAMDMTNPTAALQMAMTVNGSMSAGADVQSGTFSFAMVDGIFYLQDPESMEWIGMPLDAVLESSGMGLDPSMFGAMGSDMGSDPTAALSMLGLEGTDPNALLEIPGFITQSRMGDEDMMGQTMYVFNTTVDIGVLFASAEFQSMMNDMTAAAMSDPESPMAQFAMMTPLLQGLTGTVSTTQWIGADDMYIHQTAVDINGGLDLSMLMGGGSDVEMPPITLDMHFDVSLADINNVADVVAPEGAKILTPEEVQEMMGGAMGGF